MDVSPAGNGVALKDVTRYLDQLLRIAEIPDYSGALNGLQVENSGSVRKIAAAVDASQASIDDALDGGADLLLVHHGLFWDGNQPLTGRRFRRIGRLLAADAALYSAHLPLDVHPELGNNVLLARELGIEPEGRFGDYKGEPLGVWGRLEVTREALAARLDSVLGSRVKLVPGGPERIRRVGVITGGAGQMIAAATAAGLDAFVTGEGAHHNYFDAREGGINLLLGGHYATEVWGVRALARHLSERFELPWRFIDQPTGL
ncbi:Nif3-like dinuclear metal center hexameric protein [soil metagenome]